MQIYASAQLSLSVELFVLFPMVRRQLDSLPLVVVTCTSAVVSVSLTASLSLTVGIISFVGLLVIILLCPLLFVHWQSHKETIHGPWDEAIPSI